MEADEVVTECGLPVGSGGDTHIDVIIPDHAGKEVLDGYDPIPSSVSTLASCTSPARGRQSQSDSFMEMMWVQILNDSPIESRDRSRWWRIENR